MLRGHIKLADSKTKELSLNTISGYLDIENVSSNNIKAYTTSGDISLSNVEGETNAGTTSGNITISYAHNPIRSSSFKTSNGIIDLSFKTDLNAVFNYQILNVGEFKSDFNYILKPGSHTLKNNKVKTIEVGKGGPILNIRTDVGSIFLRRQQ